MWIPDVVRYHEVDGCSELRVRSFPDGLIATSPSTAAPYHPAAHSSPWRIPWSIECSRVRSNPARAPRRTPCSINAWRSNVSIHENAGGAAGRWVEAVTCPFLQDYELR